VRKIASLANARDHKLVMIIESHANQPQELRFLDAATGWRWLNARIELGGVKLQKDLSQKVRLVDVKIVASGKNKARNFARLVSELWDLQFTEELPSAGNVAVVEDDGELQVQFHADPGAEPVGPILHVRHFEVI
jgi:rRNA maturation protein Rpf1